MTYIDDPQDMFGWQTFPEGRARFNGLVRGGDEAGHNSLCVDLGGAVSYGEIELEATEDRRHYGLVVLSMGWKNESSIGAPLDPNVMRTFSPLDVEKVQRLIAQLVAEFVKRDERPAFLASAPTAFTGSLRFAEGWCFVASGDT